MTIEVASFNRSRTDEKTRVNDALKISFSLVEGGLNEIKFTRTSTNSRDPKTNKFYLTDREMFELEDIIKIYNEGLNDDRKV